MGKAQRRAADKSSRSGAVRARSFGAPNDVIDNHSARTSDPNMLQLLFYLLFKVIPLLLISVPFWFLTALLSLVYGRPPKMVFPSQTNRFMNYAMQSNESKAVKADLMMTILLHTATSRISGFCWLLDEIIYGRQLKSLQIQNPLFVMSAYRSASTEMARILSKDTDKFVAPNAIMCAFPYLWLWNLITWIIGDDSGITTEEANGYLNKSFSKESLERHDNNHFAIDTFDGYFLSSHLNGLAFQLGADVIVKEFNCARFEEHNRYLFEYCFVEHVDRIARKTLLYYGASYEKTFLLKGHFLQSANALQKKYPEARFLSVLRDPMHRLQSGINHMAVNSTLWQRKAPNWHSLTDAFQQIEVQYCELEMEWYKNGNDTRFVVKFEDFTKNNQKTIIRIYQDLLESNPDEIPHYDIPSKTPKCYTVNRSLGELGVNEAILKQQLVRYYAWMKEK